MRLGMTIREASLTYEEYVYLMDSLFIVNEKLANVIPAMFQEIKAVILQLSKDLKQDVSQIVAAFKSGEFFKLIKTMGFDMILSVLKAASHIISAPMNRAFKELYDTKAFEGFSKDKPAMKAFLDKHPILRGISRFALTGILIFLWITIPFVGSFDYDFDMNDIINAFKGKYKIEDFLASPDLVGYFSLLIVGEVTGLSWVWLTSNTHNIAIAILYSLYKRYHPEFAKEMSDKVIFSKV